MRPQPLRLRKFLHSFEGFLERGFVVFHDAGAALELVHGQAGEGGPRAVRRQDVAGAGDIIAEDCGRIVAEEDGPGGDAMPPLTSRALRVIITSQCSGANWIR